MSDNSPSMKGVEALSTLVELTNRIKVRADYDVVVAAFEDLDDDSKMATEFNTNFTKTTTDTGGQLDSSGLDDTQAKVKQVVLMFARNFAALRMRCDQDSIEVTREEITRAKKAAYMIVRVLGPPGGATVVAAKNADLKAEKTELKTKKAELMATNAELKAKNAWLEARITEMAGSIKLEVELPLLQIDTEYLHTNHGNYGGDDVSKSHLGDEEDDMASIGSDNFTSLVEDFGLDAQENDDTISLD